MWPGLLLRKMQETWMARKTSQVCLKNLGLKISCSDIKTLGCLFIFANKQGQPHYCKSRRNLESDVWSFLFRPEVSFPT